MSKVGTVPEVVHNKLRRRKLSNLCYLAGSENILVSAESFRMVAREVQYLNLDLKRQKKNKKSRRPSPLRGVTQMHKRHCEDSFTTTTDVVLHVTTTLYDTLQCRRSRVSFPATEPHMVVIKVITLMYPEKYTGTEHFFFTHCNERSRAIRQYVCNFLLLILNEYSNFYADILFDRHNILPETTILDQIC